MVSLGKLGSAPATPSSHDDTKHSDSGEHILRDGSIAFTGEQSMGTNKLTDVVDPTADQHAATKKYVDDNEWDATEHTALGDDAPHHAVESGESGTHTHGNLYYTEVEHGDVSPQGHHAQAHGPSDHTEGTGWRMVYQDTDGDDTEIGFSDDGKVLTSAGAAAAPTFEVADGHAHTSQASITTVGTIGTGTWQGSVIDHERGGIEADISAITTGGLLVGTGAGVIGILAVGADGLVLTAQADGTAAWEAAGGGGGQDLATDTLWAAQGDLVKGTGDDAADILSIGAANSVLWTDGAVPSWSAAPRLANIADTGGTTRYTTSAASPENLFTGDVQIDGHIGVNVAPTAAELFWLGGSSTITSHLRLMQMNHIPTINANNLSVIGLRGSPALPLNAGTSGTKVYGLDFSPTVRFDGNAGMSKYDGVHVKFKYQALGSYTGTVTEANMIELYSVARQFIGTPAITVTNMRGLYIKTMNLSDARITFTTYTQLHIEDVTGTSAATKLLMEVGPATPYFRCVGNFTAAANETPIYISEGATPTLRQLQTKDGAAIGGGDLVCVLV